MGILNLLRRDQADTQTTRRAVAEAKKAPRSESGADPQAEDGGALQRMVEAFRDIGIDGKFTFDSAEKLARKAQRGRAKRNPDLAIRRIIRSHRRRVTAGGFLTGLGGAITLPVLLPTNVFEFYVQATRMVAAIAAVRGYDLSDDEVRTRVLAALVGEESGDVLRNIGLGPVAGFASPQVAKRLPQPQISAVASAIGGRIRRRFGLRSVRLFGKAIPGLGGVIGAATDRSQLKKIAKAAQTMFPQT
ncbi:EcsC family protein [Brevibacterium ihuae]|uniref:EcsC family protein n=1 Tax=Brevibacterium ihuae TaxID=1631743 RepID=UPI000C792380|nr:EcsC family protein [Brevibacterium ihuae]